ncbi:SGNH/GDSL hydrolase family protein [Nocardia africana]
MTAIHRASLLDSGPLITRTLSHSHGGCGAIASPLSVGTSASIRIPVMLPVGTDQWRIKLRIYDTKTPATKTAVTGTKIIHGDATVTTSGAAAETGTYSGSTATTIVGSSFTIPGDGSWYTSPWVTAAGDQFDAGKMHLVGVSWTQTAATNVVSIGRCWYWSNANGVDPTVAGSAATVTAQFPPIDYVIEYQCTSSRKAFLCIGDSIMEGTQASAPATTRSAVGPTSLWRRYTDQWTLMPGVNALVQNHALYNTNTGDWVNTSYGPWTRQDTSLGQFDGAIVGLGSNDAAGFSTALATYQSNMATILANVQSIIGAGKPIYIMNVTPRNLTANSSQENARLSYNDWWAALPTSITGVVDADRLFRGTSAPNIDAALSSSDNCHPSYQGSGVLAAALQARIPT